MDRRLKQFRAEMNLRFDEQDVRIRGLEQGRAYMSGQFSALKACLTYGSQSDSDSQSGD